MEWLIGLALAALLYATRKRLAAAEERVRQQSEWLNALAAELSQQTLRVSRLERHLPADPAAFVPAPVSVELPDASIASIASIASMPRELTDRAAVPLPAAEPMLSADMPEVPAPASSAQHEPALITLPVEPSGPDPVLAALARLREMVFGGNTVVRVGILVLLVGVVLLLGWAAEHELFPIELRLAATALAALGLTAFGFRERNNKPGFALTLQGGGIAALYLVVCFSYRSYGLLPPALTFGLLCVLAVVSGVLSVRQDSKSLIVIAQLCGFAAPVLASSGHGSHVGLFSYYLILNLLVFAVAYFKAWRALNLIGFVFTFGVASAWGVLSYEPGLFASTEPFLIAFFALYVAIPVLFALRHDSATAASGGWVDGSLVFGVPLSTMALQWSLVHDRPFGMAFSALGMGAVYLVLTWVIKHRAPQRLAALGQAFLPVGIGFATLAVPYGLDDHHLTGATWALEGAGLYWVGVRQQRWLSRAAGVLLQLLAAGAANLHPQRAANILPVLNSWFLAGAFIGSGALFVAQYAWLKRTELPKLEAPSAQALIVLGVWFWLRAAFGEVTALVPRGSDTGAELAVLGAFALLLEYVARRRDWLPGRVPGLGLWPAMLYYLCFYAWELNAPPLSHAGFIGWPLMAAAMFVILRRLVEGQPRLWPAHPGAIWLWSFWLVLTCEYACAWLDLDVSYGASAANLSVALVAAAILTQSADVTKARWPSGAHVRVYVRVVMAGLALYGFWRGAIANLTLPGAAAPLPYLPILNALDLSSLFGLIVSWAWLRRLQSAAPAYLSAANARRLTVMLCLGAFAWWNSQLARSVHHYGHVPFDPEQLFEASALQLAFSLSWTLIALSMMWFSNRRGLRSAWLAAASLLVLVVAKLFLLDLSHLDTPAKIASFLGVGVLLLLIGYVAPAPPRQKTAAVPTGATAV